MEWTLFHTAYLSKTADWERRLSSRRTTNLSRGLGKSGAVPGKHKVVLQSVQEATVDSNSDPKAAMEAYMKMRGGSGKKNTAPSNDPSGGAFPKEYSDASKTPLQYEVGASGNEFDIVIP